MRAFITGLAGPVLSDDEWRFLRDVEPWGLIVFKRNVAGPDSLCRLIEAFRDAVGRPAPVLIDQEGGRVQRLGPPHWPSYPPGAAYGELYRRDRDAGLAAARLGARLIAADLSTVGIDVDCLPLADIPVADADLVIGDRAYGHEPAAVAAIAAAVAGGLADGGVLPVLKHIPGHGRATADSHLRLPRVDADRAILEATDFSAFRPLADLPLGMTAHVVFSAIDAGAPATTSTRIVQGVIRDSIGFKGALMTDDISMGALSGSLADRSHAAIAAGCDLILHCNGNLAEMQAVAAAVPLLDGAAGRRTQDALAAKRAPSSFDLDAGRADFARLMGGVWQRPGAGS